MKQSYSEVKELEETVRVLRAVALSAIAYVSDVGVCCAADDESGYCDDDDCTYCALARVVQMPTKEQLGR